jgi:hypothetical protein
MICLVRSFWRGSETKTHFSQSFGAAVDWYKLAGVGDIIRDAIAIELAGAPEDEDDSGKLKKIVNDVRART